MCYLFTENRKQAENVSPCIAIVSLEVTALEKNDLLHYKNLLLSKQQELSVGKSRHDSPPPAGDLHGDPADMASSEVDASTQIRLQQSDGKLLRAIEKALARVQREDFGVCEECAQPISKARLEAVPWTRWCRECKEKQDS
jgi:DnaK suppressor protein